MQWTRPRSEVSHHIWRVQVSVRVRDKTKNRTGIMVVVSTTFWTLTISLLNWTYHWGMLWPGSLTMLLLFSYVWSTQSEFLATTSQTNYCDLQVGLPSSRLLSTSVWWHVYSNHSTLGMLLQSRIIRYSLIFLQYTANMPASAYHTSKLNIQIPQKINQNSHSNLLIN